MATDRSAIEWTEATWNPVRGCSIVSAGCTNCYAMKQAHRFSGPGQPYEGLTRLAERGPIWTGRIRLVPELLDQPLRWKRPRRIFVNSMSDLFHPDVPPSFVDRVFEVMGACNGEAGRPHHIFQVLTKRPELIQRKLYDVTTDNPCRALGGGDYLPNVWLGISCEDQETADERIPLLLQTPAAVRFVSYEPALGPVKFDGRHAWCPTHDYSGGFCVGPCPDRRYIDWLIIGGESGPNARPFNVEWARTAVSDVRQRTKVFIKQLGSWAYDDPVGFAGGGATQDGTPISVHCRLPLRDRKGGEPSEWPADLGVREFPS